MKTRKIGLTILSGVFVISSILLASCQGTAANTSSPPPAVAGKSVKVDGGIYTNLSAAELNDLMSKKDFQLVNVHTPFEGNLPKTDLSIPYDTISLNLAKFPQDKNARIVLYCRSGRMSSIAAQELVKQGYTNVWNLDGGMVAWEQAGLPVEK